MKMSDSKAIRLLTGLAVFGALAFGAIACEVEEEPEPGVEEPADDTVTDDTEDDTTTDDTEDDTTTDDTEDDGTES